MSDEELRELERRWKESGDETDAMRLLQAQLRVGHVTAAEILSCTVEHSAAQRAKNERERLEVLREAHRAALETMRAAVPYTPDPFPLERRWTDHSCERHEPLRDDRQWGDWQIGTPPTGGRRWYRRCRFCPLRRFFMASNGGECPACLHVFHARTLCPSLGVAPCTCHGPTPRERR